MKTKGKYQTSENKRFIHEDGSHKNVQVNIRMNETETPHFVS